MVPRSQPASLPQELLYLLLSALLYNLLYVLEQVHSTPQYLQLLMATPGGAASLFSLVPAKFRILAPALASGTQLLVDNRLAARPSEVPAYVPDHGQVTGFTPVRAQSTTEPCNSVCLANSPKPGTKWAQRRLGNTRGDKSFSRFETGESGCTCWLGHSFEGYCQKLSGDVGENLLCLWLLRFPGVSPVFTLGVDAE